MGINRARGAPQVTTANPYRSQPDHAFWKRSVAALLGSEVDPVVEVPFQIGRSDWIATAGSCFAQHISRTLVELDYRYMVTEPAPAGVGAELNYGVFPARFGNIYTVRQLLQTFDRAYGLFRPLDVTWQRSDGALVDPFRPQIQPAGFGAEAELLADRKHHLACVRAMFEGCDVFIFTLGLTEAWVSSRDGAVFPVAPGVSGGAFGDDYAFHNLTVAEMTADLLAFIAKLRAVNPDVRLIFTVSPVALVATYESRHVLTANTYSKAALRVVADEVVRATPRAAYFPSYEIITGPQARGRYFADDLRSVTQDGVAQVMSIFSRHLLADHVEAPQAAAPVASGLDDADQLRFEQLADVVCEEEALDP